MLRTCRDPAIAMIAKNAGFDFVMVDMEHQAYSFETLADLFVTGRGLGLGTFVRVPELTRGYVSRALDCGANGVMIPMLETVEQARSLAGWAKYPPLGVRGMSTIGPHTDYAKFHDLEEYIDAANHCIITIAQIETAKGVEAVESIAAVTGLDALLVGPGDLAISLACPGELTAPAVEHAIERVANAAAQNGKIFGLHGPASMLARWVPYGMRLVMLSTDTDMLVQGMMKVSSEIEELMHA